MFRHSWYLEWKYEPWFATSIIDKVIRFKTEQVTSYIVDVHLPRSVESYLLQPEFANKSKSPKSASVSNEINAAVAEE